MKQKIPTASSVPARGCLSYCSFRPGYSLPSLHPNASWSSFASRFNCHFYGESSPSRSRSLYWSGCLISLSETQLSLVRAKREFIGHRKEQTRDSARTLAAPPAHAAPVGQLCSQVISLHSGSLGISRQSSA